MSEVNNLSENEGRILTPLESEQAKKLAPKPIKEIFTAKASTRVRTRTEDSEDWDCLK